MKKYNSSLITDYRVLIVLMCNLQFVICNLASAQSLSANAGRDTALCLYDSIQIGAKPSAAGGTPSYTYSWQPASWLDNASAANPNAFPTSQTTFTLTVTDGAGNSSADVVTVSVLALPDVNAGADQTIIQGTSTTLQASGAINYLWIPAQDLSKPDTPTPIAEPGVSTTYCVAGRDANGCVNLDCMTIDVTPSDEVIIYNAFSPNADGVNETLYIGNIQKFPDNRIEVFNRNGKIVFQESHYKNGWNGKVDGAELPCATYYVVFYPEGGKRKVEGAVTIIR